MLGKLPKVFGKKNNSNAANTIAQVKTAGENAPQDILSSGDIGSLSLSKEEQKKLLDERKKIPLYVILLKYTSILAFTLSLITSIFLKIDLDINNKYLGIISAEKNTGAQYATQNERYETLTKEIALQKKVNNELQRKIDEKDYGIYTELRKIITSQDRNWYSGIKTVEVPSEEDPSLLVERKARYYGLLDTFDFIKQYFEDPLYRTNYFQQQEKLKLNCEGNTNCLETLSFDLQNEILVKNISINRQGASISLEAIQYNDRVFMLAAEIADMINAFPFYRDGYVQSFTRKKMADGDESISLNFRFNFQSTEDAEPDPDDQFFINFKNWKN